ncbi:MAG: ATP-binding protein [Streptosporangiaceae bacterium]
MTAIVSDALGARGGMTSRGLSASRDIVRGRAAEQKMVLELLRHAERGAGGVLLVDGEPGIGKSLLLRDATDEAAERGFSLVTGTADPLGQAIPLFPLRTGLHEPLAADDPGRDRPDATAWWIARMRARIQQRAAAAPVLVCLDDLQWASPVTLAVLRALPRDLKGFRVAWLFSRSSTRGRSAEYMFGLLEKDGAARVTLAPLDDEAAAAMITDALGAPPDQALADLVQEAGGASG